VFSLPSGGERKIYACLFSQNRRRFLGWLQECHNTTEATGFALRGRYVGYVERSCDLQTGTDLVLVRDIRTNDVKYQALGATGPETLADSTITVLDLAISLTGSVVWIGEYDAESDGGQGANDRRQVRMMFKGYAQTHGDVVDEGFGIVPGSLALGPRTAAGFSWAYWQFGDQARTARLQP
jgi:hypothetical protein